MYISRYLPCSSSWAHLIGHSCQVPDIGRNRSWCPKHSGKRTQTQEDTLRRLGRRVAGKLEEGDFRGAVSSDDKKLLLILPLLLHYKRHIMALRRCHSGRPCTKYCVTLLFWSVVRGIRKVPHCCWLHSPKIDSQDCRPANS